MILQAPAFTAPRETARCAEWERLYGLFVSAIREVMALEARKSEASAQGIDRDSDRLLSLAEGKRTRAKHALLVHLEVHRSCGVR